MLEKLSPHMDVPAFADVVSKRFRAPETVNVAAPPHSSWFDIDALRLRYFWYDMVSSGDQDFVRNGDWGMFYTPTTDFSMALAQWWRVLESTLKRGIAEPLSKLFAEHPEWVQWDRDNLSKSQLQKESIFSDKLANPRKAGRLTLGDLVFVLQKCMSDAGSKSGVVSKLRSEAARFLGGHLDQLRPMVEARWLNPVHLNIDNINWFRNRASHDEPLGFVDAALGRFLAKRVLSVFFQPVLEKWGFKPVIYLPS
jgi:hypothetical protein